MEIQRATGREPELLQHRAMLDAVCRADFSHPQTRFSGRGIVICAGGERYLPSVYVLVRLLRHLRCTLPVEVWHLGPREMPERMRVLLGEHGAVCVDAEAMRRVHPARRLDGWELKCYALLHSSFAEVLLLDADNCPVRNPEFLFRTPQYVQHGAIFWPDYTRFARGQAVWLASGISYRDEPEFESGQIVVDKARCWRALKFGDAPERAQRVVVSRGAWGQGHVSPGVAENRSELRDARQTPNPAISPCVLGYPASDKSSDFHSDTVHIHRPISLENSRKGIVQPILRTRTASARVLGLLSAWSVAMW